MTSTDARPRLLPALLAAAWLGACAGDCGARRAAPMASASASAPAPPPSAPAPAAPGPWEAAAAGDRHALARLGQLHRARELMAVARAQDDRRAETALAALALADDAELVLGELGELARDPRRGDAALATLAQLAARPPRGGEALDADSLARCIAALDAMSRDATVEMPRRVLAVNALRAFSRAGYLAEERITRELD